MNALDIWLLIASILVVGLQLGSAAWEYHKIDRHYALLRDMQNLRFAVEELMRRQDDAE